MTIPGESCLLLAGQLVLELIFKAQALCQHGGILLVALLHSLQCFLPGLPQGSFLTLSFGLG